MILPYDEQGSGRDTIVLLHAGVADRRMWSPVLAPLAAGGLRAVAPDLPGFGEAGLAPPALAPWQDVLDTLEALELDRVVLAGNSFGGAIAKRVAAIAPTRVAALALISAPPEEDDPSPRLKAAWEAEEEALERGDIEAAVAAVVEAWTLPGAPASQRELVADMQRRAFALAPGGEDLPEAPDPLESDPGALTRLDVPILLVAGEHDMSDFHEAAELLAAELPRARLQTIAGAGHLAPLEQPQAVCELLLELAGEAFPT